MNVDYDKLNRMVRRQKAALTRAKGNRDKVLAACKAAVAEWNQPGAMWPDCWSLWQQTLNDCYPVFQAPRLEEL